MCTQLHIYSPRVCLKYYRQQYGFEPNSGHNTCGRCHLRCCISAMKSNSQQQHTNFAMAEVVRSRLQKAQCGQWQDLFAKLLQLQRQDTRHLQERFVSSTLADSGREDFVFDKTSQKVRGTNLQTAKNILMGQSVARMDEATAIQMRDLIAAPISPDEAEALAAEVHKLRNEKSPHKKVKKSVLRRRLALLNTGAELESRHKAGLQTCFFCIFENFQRLFVWVFGDFELFYFCFFGLLDFGTFGFFDFWVFGTKTLENN